MENYGRLSQIAYETVIQAIATKQFNFGAFLQSMEEEFTRTGFREPPAMGGGYRKF